MTGEGIDYKHPDFINSDNTSKIYELWDQSIQGNPPGMYDVGSIFTRDDINRALNSDEAVARDMVPSVDVSGHGTGVAGVVAACTPNVEFIIVKLDISNGDVNSNTIGIMRGIDYGIRKSIETKLPMVINLSYGNNYGNHNGNTILEEYIDTVSRLSRLSIVVGSGNDGNSARHAEFVMGNEAWYRKDFIVREGERGINLQIWRSYLDVVDIFLITPSGDELGPFNLNQEIMNYSVGEMSIIVLNAYPTPININQETYIAIIPRDTYIEAGVWSIRFNPKSISDGRVDIWLPVEQSTSTKVEFLVPSEYTTLTIPSTAKNIITVGAYNSQTLSYAEFSGRGFTLDEVIKPNIVAPGVNIDVPTPGGGYRFVSGTSFATPFVTSGAAMLMEYGITMGNDLFLYGDKLKAYIINGAGVLPGSGEIPNPFTGWGYLCVRDSLPI